jgi:hypothetical protein
MAVDNGGLQLYISPCIAIPNEPSSDHPEKKKKDGKHGKHATLKKAARTDGQD